jgi:hypothetical protein
MPDYAANAVVCWPIETVRSAFERRCERDGLDPETELEAVIDPAQDAETFWQQLAANLHAGGIRLVLHRLRAGLPSARWYVGRG